jgi:hypothetical protein
MSAEVLLVPDLGVRKTNRARHTVPAAILTLDGLEGGRRQERSTDCEAARGLPEELEAFGAATQLCKITTELVCTAMLAEALCVLGSVVWDWLVSCGGSTCEGNLQANPSNRVRKVSSGSGYSTAAAAVWSCWGVAGDCWRSASGMRLAGASKSRGGSRCTFNLAGLALDTLAWRHLQCAELEERVMMVAI